jgi:hypothetical protein
MRVLLHPGPARKELKLGDLVANEKTHVMGLVKSGDLCCLPDGCIAEPVEVFADQTEAALHCEKMKHDDKGSDYRLVLTTEGV